MRKIYKVWAETKSPLCVGQKSGAKLLFMLLLISMADYPNATKSYLLWKIDTSYQQFLKDDEKRDDQVWQRNGIACLKYVFSSLNLFENGRKSACGIIWGQEIKSDTLCSQYQRFVPNFEIPISFFLCVCVLVHIVRVNKSASFILTHILWFYTSFIYSGIVDMYVY